MFHSAKITLILALSFIPCPTFAEPLDLPIFLEVFKHEQDLFDWHPKFTLNVPAFDSLNYPYIRSRTSDLDYTEYVNVLNRKPSQERSSVDFDSNGSIGFSDFIAFANAFGSSDTYFDLNSNGTVGFGDFLIFADAFLPDTENAEWQKLPSIDDIKSRYPTFTKTIEAGGWIGSRIVFDYNDDAYTLLKIELTNQTQKNILLYSTDHCQTWEIYELPDGKFFLEHSPSPQPLSEPPAILIFPVRAEHPKAWASYHTLSLIVPEKTTDGLKFHPPVLLSNDCFGGSRHSGGATFIATYDGKTHIVWGEATEGTQPHLPSPPVFWENTVFDASGYIGRDKIPGAPTYIATYDRRTQTLGKKVFLTYAPPPSDAHNAPGICIDTEGYLHVISGAHSNNFFYLKSLQANDAYSGWTDPVPTLIEGYWNPLTGNRLEKQYARQTYLGFIIDAQNTLHIAFRWTQTGEGYLYRKSTYASLAYQRKKADDSWESPVQLVVPPLDDYSIYYHKLAIDRFGHLYLSYSYWSKSEPYGDWQNPYLFPALLFSSDGGNSWSLTETQNFLSGLY